MAIVSSFTNKVQNNVIRENTNIKVCKLMTANCDKQKYTFSYKEHS
jgi:hypothetical protein